jgi:signal recognition particle receptor subunit beta
MTSGDRREGKLTTTVGIDYGELTLPGVARLSLFGTPGQERYNFLIRSVAVGVAGLLILVDHQSESPLSQLEYYLKTYEDLIPADRTIIGLTHANVQGFSIDPYVEALKPLGMCDSPVPVDARDPFQVRQLLERLARRSMARAIRNGVSFR